ncbi:hypothetical protein D910_11100 [Dendroctonus ponderosae]|uniref:Uncharacterized protein n=1 Tax=Dendroctonus ponderosae TaxID=77166 RepID=U4UIH6_DENPD|nr:hypothetical protein D910_11100 [Dendroctonus ponderosae]
MLRMRICDIFLYSMLIAICLEAAVLADVANDVPMPPRKSLEENPQLENDYSKRGWKTDLPMWGKRGWSNLHSGWGKRDSDSDEELDGYPSGMEKRAWQRLQGGWGKRYIPTEEDMVIRQLAAALSEDNNENTIDYYPDQDFDSSHEVNKRNWRGFSDGWGKRSDKWDKFRGQYFH